MLKWPVRAGAAIRKLFEPLQDIDVYVEDLNDEAFYRCLLNTVANGTVTVARVFALGNCDAVIKAAKVHDHAKRRALFIIDGDIAWTKGEPAPHILGLHRHEAYCIENLILCERALSLLISQEIAIVEPDAAARLDFKNWLMSIERPLLELFAAFATVHHFDSTVQTVAQGVGGMCVKCSSSKRSELNRAKVNAARDSALAAAERASSTDAAAKKYDEMLKRLETLPNPLHGVSGKDFLLPLIDFHLQSIGCRVKRKSLRIRLAGAGDVGRYDNLATALSAAARGFS